MQIRRNERRPIFFIELYVVLTDRAVRTFISFKKERFIDKMIVKSTA